MEMIGKVRRMHYRDHFSYSDIARRTGLSRNTVRKWLKVPVRKTSTACMAVLRRVLPA